jgi:hypothetical protein
MGIIVLQINVTTLATVGWSVSHCVGVMVTNSFAAEFKAADTATSEARCACCGRSLWDCVTPTSGITEAAHSCNVNKIEWASQLHY